MKNTKNETRTCKTYTTDEIRKLLYDMADPDYRRFMSSLLPAVDEHTIIGVRLPLLRKLARQIARSNWRTFLMEFEDERFEETMLRGMVIGYIKADFEEVLQHVARFVPKINNWSVCDSFCSTLKITKSHRQKVWQFLQPYFTSEEPYDLRFSVVMLLNYYIDEAYIDQVLQLLNRIRHEDYYVKMAVAWAISICYIKLPQYTLGFLKQNDLDDFTYNKALQKIIESRTVDNDTRTLMRSMKRQARGHILQFKPAGRNRS